MTVLAFQFSCYHNGVSELHGQVSRRMWQGLWPDTPEEKIPITHITNGVHLQSWVYGPIRQIFDKYLAHSWRERIDDPDLWERLDDIPDGELWAIHMAHGRSRGTYSPIGSAWSS